MSNCCPNCGRHIGECECKESDTLMGIDEFMRRIEMKIDKILEKLEIEVKE